MLRLPCILAASIGFCSGGCDFDGNASGGLSGSDAARNGAFDADLSDAVTDATLEEADAFVPLPITVANHSFEDDAVASGTYAIVASGWIASNVAGSYDRNSGSYATELSPTPDSDGEQMAFVDLGALYQVLGITLETGVTYKLTVDVGNRTGGAYGGGELKLGTGSTLGADLLTPTIINDANPPNGGWVLWETTFVVGSGIVGEPLRVELHADAYQVTYDNVRLERALE
jgi:hypothetical protein